MNSRMSFVTALVCFAISTSIAKAADDAKVYADENIANLDTSHFFARLEQPDKHYSIYAAPSALGKKCKLNPDLALPILNRAAEIYFSSGSDFAKRQCLLIFSETTAVVTLPIQFDALKNGKSAELRSLAAYCLPNYKASKKIVTDALESALQTEKNTKVQSSIRNALQRTGLK
jgi:hypothetical protein